MSRILFSGTKSFWKTKNSVEIAIVEHADHDVFEIIVVDTASRVEAKREFLDAIALYTKLKPEFGSPMKGTLDGAADGGFVVKTHSVSDKAVSTFIFNHLFIKTYLPVSGVLEIEVRSAYMEEEHNDLMVARPADLPLSASPIEGSIQLPTGPSASPEQEERRRPLIFTRVSQGLSLSESDAQIWARFAQNKTQPELVDAMTRTVVNHVPEDESVLHNAAHAAMMLPAQTPFPAPRLSLSRSAMLPSSAAVATDPDMITPTKASPRGADPSPPATFVGSPGAFLRGMFGMNPSADDRSPRSSVSSAQGRSRSSSSFSVDRTPDDIEDAASSPSRTTTLLRTWAESLQRGLHLQSAPSNDGAKSPRETKSAASGASAVGKVQSMGALADAHRSRDYQPSGVWPTGSPSGAIEAGASLRAARRHTYHPDLISCTAAQPSCSAPSIVAKPQHRRAVSGSSNRVQPTTVSPDDSAEIGHSVEF